jgi:hypothetical protein
MKYKSYSKLNFAGNILSALNNFCGYTCNAPAKEAAMRRGATYPVVYVNNKLPPTIGS